MRNRTKAARCIKSGCKQFASFFWAALFLLALSACGDTKGAASKNDPEPFTFGGSLYVANGGDGRLLVFDPRPTAPNAKPAQSKPIPRVDEGNVFPDRQFPDALSGPAGIFLDRDSDTLYVANSAQNAIQIYDKASTLTAPVPVSRVISGDKTLLDEPFAVTFDAATGRIFVANRGGNTITAYHASCLSGASLDGNIAPCNLLVGEQTLLDFPRGLAVDTSRNHLYISNSGSDSILVYEKADTIGATPSSCVTDFTACNQAPTRVISPHTGAENVSKLELPFGIHIDSVSDRLYVVNTGLNTPGVLIYENASLADGGVVPARVIAGLKTQLTTPSGIDVDPARGRVTVVNSNSPNNVNASNETNSGAVEPGGRTECPDPCPVNASGGDNVDSPSLVVFNDIETACLAATSPCNLTPDRRIGGDVSPEVGTTLSSPLGVAFDPSRETTYIANTGANSIFVYSLGGNTAPLKENAGNATELNIPSGFFYDPALDRLYITNATNGSSPSVAPITVYNHVSDQSFKVPKAPHWKISGSSFSRPRGVYIDKTRSLMLVADGSSVPPPFPPRHGLIAYDLNQNFFQNPLSTPVPFPLNDADGPAGSATATVDLQAPVILKRATDGLSSGGPSAMSVDEARGEVYVADKNNNSVVVFKLPPPVGDWLKDREITGLKSPSGVFIDTQRDILYVTNNGVETGVSKDNAVFVFDNASTKGDGLLGCPTPCRPDRILSTEGFSDENKKLKAPISPYVDLATDRLYLIKSATHITGVVTHPEAVLTFEDASTLGDAAAVCLNGTVACADTDPNKVKILSGDKTRLAFWQDGATTPLRRYTGAVFLSKHNNNDTLYVGQSVQKGCAGVTCSNGALLVYGIEGRVPPGKIWIGGSGGFTSPEAIAVDSQNKTLYVANQTSNTLSILTNADQVDVTTKVKTDITNIQLNRPAGLAVDAVQNRLYVSNSESANCGAAPCNAILAFNNPANLANGAAPNEIITDAALQSPRGVAVDADRKRLYAASHGNDAVLVFSLEGAAVRSLFLSGFQSRLDQPIGVAIDTSRDLLYVLNQGTKEVLVFENASGLTGNAAPAWCVPEIRCTGNNFIANPSAIFVDAEKDLFYIADRGANAVYIFPEAGASKGQTPHKTLSGDKTGLLSPSAITVDTASP